MSEEKALADEAPLLQAYLSYLAADRRAFTIPGHKQHAGRVDRSLGQLVDSDVPLFGGLDEVKLTNQLLVTAEARAATCWAADYARFSSGGSTHANQAVALALGSPGDKVAVSRTAHRSILSGLMLAGLEPVWMFPEVDTATGVPLGISAAEVKRVLANEKPVAVLLTEPGYLGTLSNLGEVIEAVRGQADIPVVVDAAWGAHFGFHPAVPRHAFQFGADALVTSTHKALPGYSASSLLLARTTHLSAERLEQAFETTHTTSPPGAILASVDACRALLQTRGFELIERLLATVAAFKQRVQAEFSLPIFLEPSDFEVSFFHSLFCLGILTLIFSATKAGRFDPTKIVLRASQLGLSGVDVENALLEHKIRVELADRETVVFMATIVDDSSDFDFVAEVLIPILKKLQAPPRACATAISWSTVPQRGISMRDAYFAKTERVAHSDAVGRISADLIAPYPPGVAVVAPGEILTKEIIDGLRQAKMSGVRIAYASDKTLEFFRVVLSNP
eukprot:m.337744 g.337744  ORF g.337744 m.337744 type:complete len:506 (-) comp55726_c0_seq31:72-1589(-)